MVGNKKVKKLIGTLVVAIVSLIAFELISRAVVDRVIPKIRFNSVGMRGSKELSEYKNSAQKKILFLGNSVTLGLGVQEKELFTEILSNNLKVLAINGGYDGANLLHLYNIYMRELKNIKPDFLVYIPIAPDLGIDYDMNQESLPGQYIISKSPPKEEKKYLYEMFKFLHLRIRDFNTKVPGIDITWEDNSYTKSTVSPIEQKIKWKVRAILSSLNQEVEKGHGKMLIITVPSREIYYIYSPSMHLKKYEDLKEIADDLGIRCINLAPNFKMEVKDDKAILFMDKVHFNSNGHKVLAELLTDLFRGEFTAKTDNAIL